MAISKITSDSTSGVITSGTVVSTTSGTSATFTNIPSWVKRITVMLNGCSQSAVTGTYSVRLGTGGSLVSSGYVNNYAYSGASGGNPTATDTNGIAFVSTIAAANTIYGQVIISNVTGNTWVSSYNIMVSNTENHIFYGAGRVTLAGTLDTVGLVLTAGTAFDAGSINILYE